ncbi:NTP transferase domain-containing protein [Subtercola endophyticus]|uniref:NTP transferase domain-containing protein n=1 Tax=Subtercola endophyticus TaxID=2895559 RepID=UPI001E2ACE77|nr:NTP transferase domain-containing protein [Subtercola endophyticus]UFS58074.1 NTP transferase domain-containing protein [Subtercola endophyticus]
MNSAPSNFVAIVLAGGRSARLGGQPKAALRFKGQTLLERTLDAVADARHIVVVGDPSVVAGAAPRAASLASVAVTRETPPFAGPAAGIAAGIEVLVEAHPLAPFVVVLACDMPGVGAAVHALLAAAERLDPAAQGAMAVDEDGRAQYLTAVYRTEALSAAVALAREAGSLANLSVKRLLSSLMAVDVPVPAGSTRDVDTFDDAADFGIATTMHSVLGARENGVMTDTPASRSSTDDQAALLAAWAAELVTALGVGGSSTDVAFDAQTDVDTVLALAGVAAHAVVRPAAPLTTYLVGYATGLAVAAGADAASALNDATAAATALAKRWQAEHGA